MSAEMKLNFITKKMEKCFCSLKHFIGEVYKKSTISIRAFNAAVNELI